MALLTGDASYFEDLADGRTLMVSVHFDVGAPYGARANHLVVPMRVSSPELVVGLPGWWS